NPAYSGPFSTTTPERTRTACQARSRVEPVSDVQTAQFAGLELSLPSHFAIWSTSMRIGLAYTDETAPAGGRHEAWNSVIASAKPVVSCAVGEQRMGSVVG